MTVKKDNNVRVVQTNMAISLTAANKGEFPMAYTDDIWDNVEASTALAEMLGGAGQYDQHAINEAMASILRQLLSTQEFTITYHYGRNTDDPMGQGLQTGDSLTHIDTYRFGDEITEFDNEGNPHWSDEYGDLEWHSYYQENNMATNRYIGNFQGWVDSQGKRVEIPTTMPSHNIEVWALYDVEEEMPMA